MTRRILAAIVAVAAFAVALFGVPLAVGAHRLYRKEVISELERDATRAGVQIPASFASTGDPVELPRRAGTTRLAVYDDTGRKVAGVGPTRADAVVRTAMRGSVSDTEVGGQLVVALALTSEERIFAVIRAATPTNALRQRTQRTWLAMTGFGLLVLAAAALAGRALARRLSHPLIDLASAARHVGDGDFTARAPTVGISELDDAADALNATAERLGHLVERERAFSADASHQLRTPLTGLRLQLEAALAAPEADRGDAISDALDHVDHLDATITDLLALARDTGSARPVVNVDELCAAAESRWHGHLAAAGRQLRILVDPELPTVRASPIAIATVLDVLVDNASRHGAGTVTIRCRPILDDAVAIEVTDEGDGPAIEQLFQRRAPSAVGTGIGLALARSLAEAEGGRLVLAHRGPRPAFRLVLPAGNVD